MVLIAQCLPPLSSIASFFSFIFFIRPIQKYLLNSFWNKFLHKKLWGNTKENEYLSWISRNQWFSREERCPQIAKMQAAYGFRWEWYNQNIKEVLEIDIASN